MLDFNIVEDCGFYGMPVIRYKDMYYLGYFEGNYKETVAFIKSEYVEGTVACNNFLKKIDEVSKEVDECPIDETEYSEYLTIATKYNCYGLIDYLVKIVPNLYRSGVDALEAAIRRNYVDLAELLISHGVKLNGLESKCSWQSERFLVIACKYGYKDMVDLLLRNYSCPPNELHASLVYFAIKNGHHDLAKFLVEKGYSIDSGIPFLYALKLYAYKFILSLKK